MAPVEADDSVAAVGALDEWTEDQIATLMKAVDQVPLRPTRTRWRRIAELVEGNPGPRECYYKYGAEKERSRELGGISKVKAEQERRADAPVPTAMRRLSRRLSKQAETVVPGDDSRRATASGSGGSR